MTTQKQPLRVKLLGLILRRWLKRVELTADVVARLSETMRVGQCIYLVRAASWLEYLLLLQVTKTYGLAEPRQIFGLAKKDKISVHTKVNSTAAIFLKNVQTAQFDPIFALVEQSKANPNLPIFLLPITIVWQVRPRHVERNFFSVLIKPIGSSRNFLKGLWFIFNPKQIHLLVAPEIKLHEFVKENPASSDTLARKIRLTVRYHLASEERATLGSHLIAKNRLYQRLCRDPQLQATINRVAKHRGVAVAVIEKEVKKTFQHMAADFNWRYIQVMEWLTRHLLQRFYEGIHMLPEGIQYIREALKKGPVVLLPTHKSHMDYVILSASLKNQQLPLPFIAAGENLSFFPLGGMFRRGGAFFIRRSFLGDELYETLLKTYLKILLQERYLIEFFIEGTRSRSGKVLAPKFGMLSMLLQLQKELPELPIQVVPLTINYEFLVEEAGIVAEAQGAEKKKENVQSLVKARNKFKRRYGNVYINVDCAYALNELADHYQTEPKPIGYHLIKRIEQQVVATPTAIVASAIAIHHKRGIRRETLLEHIRLLEQRIRDTDARLTSDFDQQPINIDRALALLIANKDIRLLELRGEKVYVVERSSRLKLDYYKNNIIHFFVNTSFAALSFRKQRQDTFASLWQAYSSLQDLFAEEFHRLYQPATEQELLTQLQWLQKHRLVTQNGDFWQVINPVAMIAFENFTRNFLESTYTVVLTLLESFPRQEPREMKIWLKLAADMSQLLYFKGDLWRSESRSKINLDNVLISFRHRHILIEVDLAKENIKTKRLRRKLYRVAPDAEQKLKTIYRMLHELLMEVQFN